MGIDEWKYTLVTNPQRVKSGDKEKYTEVYCILLEILFKHGQKHTQKLHGGEFGTCML